VSWQLYLPQVKEALKKAPRGNALSYFEAFDFKTQMAEFHVTSLPRELGSVAERSHTEAAIFQMKAALDCIAEAVNQIYQLWIRSDYALSIEQLAGVKGKGLASRNNALRSSIGRLRRERWWLDFKGLRDRLTHQGLVIHHFAVSLGGPEPARSAHLEVSGRRSDKELRNDLEDYLTNARACGEEVCRLLLLDRTWPQV